MSSKVFGPDDQQNAMPLAWRDVSGRGGGPATHTADPGRNLAELQRQVELRTREAHAEGMREGEAAGRSRAAAELQPIIEKLTHSIDELGRMRPRLRREAESDMIKLSLAIARRVLRRELSIDPEAVRGLAMAALEKLQGQEISRVRVHPAHAPPIGECLRKLSTGTPVEVLADASCEPGTVIFETQRGNLDASVDSQLKEIERGLADQLRRHA
jgi:flagellar assembly protein FliH